MRLFSSIIITNGRLTLESVRRVAQHKPFLLHYVKYIRTKDPNLGMLLNNILYLACRTPHLQHLHVTDLDFAQSHPLVSRIPACISLSLDKLYIQSCRTTNVDHLCRFITSFKSLSVLLLDWHFGANLANQGQFHLQFSRSKCSLVSLAIKSTPNLSILLDSFIKSSPLVDNLRNLIVASTYLEKKSMIEEIMSLLHHCRGSLEELIVIGGTFFSYHNGGIISPSESVVIICLHMYHPSLTDPHV